MENSKLHKIAVVGFGNILMGDEGVGVHVIKELQNPSTFYRLPSTVELIDGGTASFDVILSLKNVDKLIIIDAIKNGGISGEIYKFQNFQISKFGNLEIEKLSLHDINIIDALKIAGKVGQLPKEIIFIGIEPKEILPKLELSEEVKNKIPEVIKMVMSEINHDCLTAKAN
ncbi:MAG: HyaD/HybD family hydrogenase maturation endopeptidase [Elusimicrobiota bacterium]